MKGGVRAILEKALVSNDVETLEALFWDCKHNSLWRR